MDAVLRMRSHRPRAKVARQNMLLANDSKNPNSGLFNFLKRNNMDRSVLLSGFTDVDKSPDPSAYVRYVTLTNSEPALQSSKACLYQFLKPKAGDRILDAGCGVGFDTMALAQLVGNSGSVVGIDCSKTMIAEAKKLAGASELPVQFHVGDVHCLEFEAAVFDAAFIASTFMHLRHPFSALSEIIRTLRSGGHVVALECDWETLVLGFDNPKLEKNLVAILRQAIRNPGIGHQLPILFDKVGLRGIGVAAWTLPIFNFEFANQVWRIQETLARAVSALRMSKTEADKVLKALRKASEAGRFFGAATAFAVQGTKPS